MKFFAHGIHCFFKGFSLKRWEILKRISSTICGIGAIEQDVIYPFSIGETYTHTSVNILFFGGEDYKRGLFTFLGRATFAVAKNACLRKNNE